MILLLVNSIEMKRMILLIFALATFAIQAQDIKVMTYNIRYDNQWDTINSWEKRKGGVFKILEESSVDIFGVQEALHHQIEDLQQAFPGFEYVGVGRDDGKTQGEYSAIFYRKEKFEIKEGSTFWLSETPEKPSVGWDASMERICTYAYLKHLESGKEFWVFNAHYDHLGPQARENSSRLILKTITEHCKPFATVMLMGDLNSQSHENPIRILQEEFVDYFGSSANAVYYKLGTFNGFQKEFDAKRIDYILIKNALGKDYRQYFDTLSSGNYPSDHFPVSLEIEFITL
jgi:endonuclease/exonuclease/phosphatase family metal-dependent hydrolase